MATPPASPLKSVQWFRPTESKSSDGGLTSSLIKIAVAGIVGAGFRLTGHLHLAYIVWGVGGTLGAASIASASARHAIDGLFARLGRAIGYGLGAVLLTLVYLLFVTPLRFVRRALGADDLHLRDAGRRTYWLACDDEDRKARWVGSMFATEAAVAGTNGLRTAVVVIIALFLLAEGILRTQGFGHTVLYVADPDVGYYPQPNVSLRRYGGMVSTNEYGMRSPSASRRKPPGTFRILMLGDSTLYGGSYVDQEDLYASRVREALNARGFPGKVEVLAMGCNGWGPFHEHGFVNKFGAFDADLTIVNMPIDDINRPLYGLMSVPFFAVQSPPRLALEEVANHLMWRYRSEHSGLDQGWEAKQSQHGILEYGRLADDLLKAHSEVMLFVLPTQSPGLGGPESPREQTWRSSLDAEVGKRGVKTYFAAGHFKDRGKVDEIYHDNVHLQPLGHHIYAEFMEKKIVEDSVRLQQWAGKKAP